MKLFVANCTQQNVSLAYRVSEETGVRFQTIGIGSQVALSGDLDSFQVDYVLKQLGKYGLLKHDEVKSTRGFVGLVYSTDRPVPFVTLEYAMRRNKLTLIERGREIRKHVAVAASNAIEDQLAENNNIAAIQKLEVSIEEEDNKTGETDPDTGQISEGIRVTRNEGGPPAPPRRQTNNKRRAVG